VEWRPEHPFDDDDDPDYVYDCTDEEDEVLEQADYDWEEFNANEDIVLENSE
jgi:hypothetical protein